ncbi:Not1-domain-containing protein [Sporormia fimetaria CBS 119925]|uniref:Not1-domain-containing protein n=1 Tax=Sporormia fimetaria CBS 119925 TaxID=1340428 RepID=A0A6A6VBM2_9PLEO|nr:Not1-domain-containing protein [Sporormia fimetaria CBS 119925]
MSQQHPWGSSRQHQPSRLPPISTQVQHTQRQHTTPSPSPSGRSQPFSPAASHFPSLPAASARHGGSRQSSAASSASSPFSAAPSGQQAPPSQLLSTRTRTIAPPPGSQLASSALPTAPQGGGAASSSAGGAVKLARDSPSLQSSSAIGSPKPSNSAASAGADKDKNLSKIVIAQIFLLLSQFGTVKDEKDRAKWDQPLEQLRKLVDTHGMDVFTKYFRRLVSQNAAQIFNLTTGRNAEPNGSYPLLVTEMQKLRSEPEQAAKIAESIDSNEGEQFRDFDLATFCSHFQLDPIANMSLALACRSAHKADIRAKADSIIANINKNFIDALAYPAQTDQPNPVYEAAIVEKLLIDPPADWDLEEKKPVLPHAMRLRYNAFQLVLPVEIEAALHLAMLTDAAQSPLSSAIHRAGPRATATPSACAEVLDSPEARGIDEEQVANALLLMAIVGNGQVYNAKNFIAALRSHRSAQSLDWQDVVRSYDRPSLRLTKAQFLCIYNALLPIAIDTEQLDIQLLWGGNWQEELTQLGFLICFLSTTPEELDVSAIPRLRASFTDETFKDASDDIKEIASKASKHPFVSLDATSALFGLIFRSQEMYQLAQVLLIPENIINPHTSEFLISAVAVPKPWGSLQEQALKQLFAPYFSKKLPDHDFVLYALWQQDAEWLVARFSDMYNADLRSLNYVLDYAQKFGWLDGLIRSPSDISLDLAAQAHARGLIEIEPWLHETYNRLGDFFRRILVNFLHIRAADEMHSLREDQQHNTLPLAVKTVHPLLWFLAECEVPETELVTLQRTCIQAYPRLINYGEGFDDILDKNGENGNRLPEDADSKMHEHFQKMYKSDMEVRDVINILRTYKESRDPAEQDLFACMIHGLFDEYSCFSEYPLDALAITAVLFGGIINFNLLSQIALQVALAMVLEAVKNYQPDEKMYKFGLQALVNFKNRLNEWPTYCEHLLTVPGLQGTEIYTEAEEVVGQQTSGLNGDLRGGGAITNGTNMDRLLQPASPTIPRFTCLHADPPLQPDLYEDPPEDVQDKIRFILNNMSDRNVEEKTAELIQAIEPRHHQWFAYYVVEDLAKVQENQQDLYLDMLERFDDRILWAEVLRETYVSVVNVLNADGSDALTRSHVRNLGGWLGSLTIARDKPILYRNISFKDLLLEGFDTDRIVTALTFTCKVLTKASKSKVFQYPNPWLTEILRLLLELYHFAELKIQQKFEIEILFKALNVNIKDIEPSDTIRSRPPGGEDFLGLPQTDGLEQYPNDLSIMGLNRARGPSERFSAAAITATLPDFSSQLILPPTGNSVALKKIFTTAVQQALEEIIGPVVERSVTIAAISTSQLVSKDFATEPDEEKLRAAAHNMVKSLSGSLALVTCKEPLRMSIMNNIRVMARELPEQALPEGHVLMFVNDNLDLICNTVETAAEVSSLNEIELQIEDAVRLRRAHRTSPQSRPFEDPKHISSWATYIPEPYKQTAGGLNREQLAIYEEFGRQSRGLPHTNNVSQDSGRQLPDVLQDQFATVPNLSTPATVPAETRQNPQVNRLQNVRGNEASAPQQLNGWVEPTMHGRPQRSVDDLLGDFMHALKEANESRLSELRPASPLHEVFNELIYTLEHSAEKDSFAHRLAAQVMNHLFTEEVRRLEIEILVALLQKLCAMSAQTSRQVLIWLATMQEDDRIFNPTVMVSLMEAGLMDMHRLNTIVAKAITQRRLPAVEMLSVLLDEVLLNEHPSVLRADFAMSIDALTNWLAEDPDLEIGKQIMAKLHVSPVTEQSLTPPASGDKDQLEYIFDEWVHLQFPDTPKKTLVAFVYQLHQNGILQTKETSIQFFRVCVDAAVASFEEHDLVPYTGSADMASLKIDALAKLIVSIVAHHGEQDQAMKESKAKANCLDRILSVVVLILVNHQRTQDERFNAKAFLRLFSTVLSELNDAMKDHSLIEYQSELYLTMAKAFLILQPQTFQGFSFQWLALMSHRIFMPAMLEESVQEGDAKDQRWGMYAQLMDGMLRYTGHLMKPTGQSLTALTFYRGVLRVMLVIHHDYPEFLADYHFRFCNSIPMHCTQLRNLIVSAYPSSVMEMPDPFSGGLKVDRLEDIRQVPVIRADIDRILSQAGVKDIVNNLLKASDPSADEVEKVCSAAYFAQPKPVGFEHVQSTADPVLIHALVLYIGNKELTAQGPKEPSYNPSSPAAKLLTNLAKHFRPEAKFHFVSAIANQLRWPNAHTHYFSYALLHLFGPPENDSESVFLQEVITRVLLERLLVHRPHPWGLIVTLLEILKNRTYSFWDLPFVKAAPEVERLLNALFTHAQQSPRPLA